MKNAWDIVKSALLYKARYYLLIIALVVGVIAIITAIIASIVGSDTLSNAGTVGNVVCTPTGQVDEDKTEDVFASAGVFTGKKQAFLDAAEKHGVDPVLFIAIVMNETGWGTSSAVVNKNNPGGVMLVGGGGLRTFATIEEGIDYTAGNLYRNYIAKGIVTIPEIGAKYAPIGAANDPTGMNMNWVPTVTAITIKLGGLTQNCTAGAAVGTGEFVSPTGGEVRVTSGYGYRTHPVTGEVGSFHKGVDFACRVGDPIYAADSGSIIVATKAGYGGGYGHHVIIDHGGKYTLYGHMTNVLVNLNQGVKQGEQIGTCGATGRVTGPHLHFEVQTGAIYGVRQDPMPFFESKKDKDDESDDSGSNNKDSNSNNGGDDG